MKIKEKSKKFEEKLGTLFETAGDPILALDKRGRLVSINHKVTELTGFTKKELIGKHFAKTKLLTPKSKLICLKNFAKRMLGKDIPPYEIEGLTKNGDIIPLEINANPIKEKGEIIGDLVILRDVTERKKLEKQRHESNKRLQRLAQKLTIAQDELKVAIETKGEFMNIAAHELRTPLQPIIGYADRLLQEGNSTDWQKERLNIILDNAQNLLKLVQDVLDINKMETGIMKFSMEEIDLLKIIKEVYDSFKPAVEEKGLKFALDTSKASDEIKVKGDPNRLNQIFSNLLDNAVKFTDKGTITIQLVEDKNSVTVSVQDTGIGVTGKDIPKLFTKFFQADGTNKRKASGTGLGLTICKEIVKAHNGKISAQSTLSKGSTFRVVLPKLTRPAKRKEV